MCDGAKDSEVQDWGRFFLQWARRASEICGPWSKKIVGTAEQILETLAKSKSGLMGFEVLKRAMADASHHLNVEIAEALRAKSTASPRLEQKVLAVAGDDHGLSDDTDHPARSRGR
jgi:hypothetical protein